MPAADMSASAVETPAQPRQMADATAAATRANRSRWTLSAVTTAMTAAVAVAKVRKPSRSESGRAQTKRAGALPHEGRRIVRTRSPDPRTSS